MDSSDLLRLSVIICAHNPRVDHLQRTLAALQSQTIGLSQWELILVDNGSSTPIASWLDLSWHPSARVVCEEQLGLTAARVRGFKESRTDLVVMVYDEIWGNFVMHDDCKASQISQGGGLEARKRVVRERHLNAAPVI